MERRGSVKCTEELNWWIGAGREIISDRLHQHVAARRATRRGDRAAARRLASKLPAAAVVAERALIKSAEGRPSARESAARQRKRERATHNNKETTRWKSKMALNSCLRVETQLKPSNQKASIN